MTRSVLVTGCSSGIGRHVALGLAERGYRVLATTRQATDVADLAARGLEAFRLDLDDPASVDAGAAEALERTGGGLYALFNNGAYGLPGAVEDLTRDALRRQFETNLFGWVQLTNRLLPAMRARGEGRIIQNSSVLGLAAFPYRGAYVATKFALEGLTDTLRMELAGTGIHVVLIEPGPVFSRFRENAYRAFLAEIDREHSAHRDRYRAMERRLRASGAVQPFTLGPEAVLHRVIQALERRRPRPRYYVTVPTYLFGALRRLLPTRALDRVLRAASGGGRN